MVNINSPAPDIQSALNAYRAMYEKKKRKTPHLPDDEHYPVPTNHKLSKKDKGEIGKDDIKNRKGYSSKSRHGATAKDDQD